MDKIQNLKPDEIREDIEDTRASLSSKLDALGSEVRSGVHDAQESVQRTVDGVKRSFSISHHVRERPWTCFVGAVLVGMALSRIASEGLGSSHPSSPVIPLQDDQESKTSTGFMAALGRELQEVRGVGIGVLAGILKDLARAAITPFGANNAGPR